MDLLCLGLESRGLKPQINGKKRNAERAEMQREVALLTQVPYPIIYRLLGNSAVSGNS